MKPLKLPVSRWLLAALAVLAIASGIDNLNRPLANPDEGRYSEISREIVVSGDWITPRLDGIKYFEKPPLQYWATAVAFEAFGMNEPAARLYVWLAGFATLLIVGFTGMRLFGLETGLASALALVASPYFMAFGGIVTLDMGLTLWTTATFAALLLAEHAHERPREQRLWMLVSWAAMALAVLSKGLVGIVFAGAAVFFVMATARSAKILRRMHWGWGLAIFAVIAAPWFVAVSRANPEFAHFFFIHEHFERFLTHEHRRVQPAWFFIPIVLAGFLPWLAALPVAIARGWRAEAGASFQPLRISLLWSGFILLFFSASGSKLPAYVLPLFPSLALVLGRFLATGEARRLALCLVLVAPVGIAIAYAGAGLPASAKDSWTQALYVNTQPWIYAAGAIVAVSCAGLAAMLLAGHRWASLVGAAFATVMMIECLENGYEELSPRQSGITVAHAMAPLVTPSTRLYSVAHYDQTLPFYLGRTLKLVDYVDEFETGQKAEPGCCIARLEDLAPDWLRPGEALAIMQPGAFEKLKALGLPMQVLHDDPRRVIVRKP
ncbi:MAG TPA: glycosyltransferase family 39 protein [Usitatibacter sp.]|nr:glycosyltransferase family 39 protein [Usitatibacter sp.]